MLHWRAGLGWHGLDCLLGPVHRDALPILAALATVATALLAALDHVIAWMRRTLAALRARAAPRRGARHARSSRSASPPPAAHAAGRSAPAGRRSSWSEPHARHPHLERNHRP